MNPLLEEIRTRLAVSPRTISELSEEICSFRGSWAKVDPRSIRAAVGYLEAYGQIRRLRKDDEEGWIFCLPDYHSPPPWRDHPDIRLARDYGAHYEAANDVEA